jgi:hypothetical protein
VGHLRPVHTVVHPGRSGGNSRSPDSYFVDNEFTGDDVNQWTTLARGHDGVTTLARATEGDLEASARYRDLFQPLGLGDELRAVLRTGDATWGLMCLHREAGHGFSAQEEQLIKVLAPHLAEGLRAGLLKIGASETAAIDAPGLVVLDQAGELVARRPRRRRGSTSWGTTHAHGVRCRPR